MRSNLALLVGAGAFFAAAAFAHQGVKNAAVKARMEAMSAIAANTKVLGEMAKGAVAFDAAAAQAAAAAIAEGAARAPALFEAQETDAMSEALPAIWADYAGFTARAEALETVARKASASIGSPEDLRAALGGIGAACKDCHADYRK